MNIAVILNYNDAVNCLNVANNALECGIDKAIIVDNNSPDQSGEFLKTKETEDIIVLLAEENGGYACGNNIGIRHALEKFSVEYLFVINSDVLFEKETISNCIQFLVDKPEYALVSTAMLDRDGNKNNNCWMFPTYKDCVKRCFKFYENADNQYMQIDSPYMEVDVVRGSFLCFRASVLEEIGGFDEGTFLYNEENIICKKIKNMGYKVGFISSCNYIHNHKVSKGVVYHDRHEGLKSSYYYLEHYTDTSSWKLRLFLMATYYCNFRQGLVNKIKCLIYGKSSKKLT